MNNFSPHIIYAAKNNNLVLLPTAGGFKKLDASKGDKRIMVQK